MPIPRDTWAEGTGHELAFWDHCLATGGGAWPDWFQRSLDPDAPLEVDRRYVAVPPRGPFRVLDVGSGPLTTLGKRLPGLDVELVAVDPLADEYNRLLDRYGVDAPVRPIRGDAEALQSVVGGRRFHLVHCRNALDHAYDPLRGMSQMLAVTEPGGVVMLQHLKNEGERQGYDGLHAWNFTARDGRLVVCRPAESWFVDEHLDDVRVVTLEEGDWVTAYLRKLAD